MTNEIRKRHDDNFKDILQIIETAKIKAFSAVNRELIEMYWLIGEYVSNKVKIGEWGKGTVKEISEHIERNYANAGGFSPSNIWRMKQFYETYAGNEKLAPLVREIGWTQNLEIMSRKTLQEREFYLALAAKNKYSKRELQRQINSSLYERTMLSKNFNAKELLVDKYEGLAALRDSYVLEFLDLPRSYKEVDLRKAIVGNLKNFILEFGKDFAFVGEEYRVQVGDTDFYIDLLFHNRELNCLVAIELKTEKFKPEHVGQMQFYLEALDRDVKKKTENASVGLILCSSKNDTVVEYTMSRLLSPSQIATYELMLPDKKILEQRVNELVKLSQDTSKK